MKKIVLITIVLLVAGLQVAFVVLHSNGVAGYTNAPGETTCTDCHVTYPLNSGGGSVAIKIPSCITSQYVPGTTYTINVTVLKSGLHLFGVDLEVLDSTGADAGTLSLLNSNTTILLYATINGHNRTNGAQYGGVAATDSCVFLFKWKAPSTNVGKITLYAAGNAADGDGFTDGDFIYTGSNTLQPSNSAGEDLLHSNNAELVALVNPTENALELSYTVNGAHLPVYADLITPTGQIAMHLFNNVGEIGKQQKRISLNPLSLNGLYIVRLSVGNKTYCKKIML